MVLRAKEAAVTEQGRPKADGAWCVCVGVGAALHILLNLGITLVMSPS